MGEHEEERRKMKGTAHPAFLGEGEGSCSGVGREQGSSQASALASPRQQAELRAPSDTRGIEGARNYFDPVAAVEGDPRRCRTAGAGAGDELELSVLKEDERGVFEKLAQMLNEDEASTSIDLPGSVMEEKALAGASEVPQAGWRDRLWEQMKERREEVIPHYVEQLREQVQDDMIPLGRTSLEQDERVERGLTEVDQARKRRVMAILRGRAKSRLTTVLQKGSDSSRNQGRQVSDLRCEPFPIRGVDQEESLLQERLYAAFQRAESRLLNALRQRQAEVIAQYGEISEATVNSESLVIESDLPWQVDWVRAPQPVEVCVGRLRAVREKLPRGPYAVSVSLHTRLAGPALLWSGLKRKRWAGVTEPVEHGGRYCDTDLCFHQSLPVVLPAPCDLLPSTVLVFRLLSMPSEEGPVSGVVAWGAFPVCNCSLALTQGTFRMPLLWGSPRPALDRFSKIEQLLATDLDTWLCNLYFQVRRVPREQAGVREGAGTLHLPSAVQLGPSTGTPEPAAHVGSSASLPGPGTLLQAMWDNWPLMSAEGVVLGRSAPSLPSVIQSDTRVLHKHGCPSPQCGAPVGERWMAPPSCVQFVKDLQGEGLGIIKKRRTLLALLQDNRKEANPRPQPCNLLPKCCGPGTRLRLVGRLLPGELGLSWSPRPRCSQLQLALVALAWFPRLYLHYCSQWLYLHARDIPVNRFRFHAHTVDVVYQGSLLSTPEEALLVLLGPLTLNTVTLGLLLIRWVCRQAFGSTPSFLSKLIMAAGAWTVLDPLAVLVVDASLGRLSYSAEEPVADAAKLYWHFHRTEHSGAAGIFITLFLYTVHFTLSVTVLYVYLLRLHNDGRVLDVYHRLHSPEGAFFIPDDLEVSNQELSYIVKKAEQWRGFNGERRKVAVHDYIWMEEESGASQSPGGVATTAGETSTHVSIYTLYVSGLRRRHRHFLRQPNGAIIEVIGDSAEAGLFVQAEKVAREEEEQRRKSPKHVLRDRKRPVWRSNRVGPVGASD
ncbi:uncharacterized protein ofcc1 [Electrophorus electricus]|uniref:uncharacterized protein ofcc1 n=1 Tax=Electrophorus electricus TaxID=8005 RepID=UPI0015CFEF93|nr:uncharacterized protein ofcc1 [Electrophorus electricus]